SWSVEVAMDLGTNGAMHAHVGLMGSRLNIRLRSDSPSLVADLTQQLDTLRASLEQQGLKVEQLVCLHGNPVDDSTARLNRLLDYHA
ncbi:MAG: flagellar hook-length control protein FliK, partial [Steroidobacter sp.]